MFTLRGPLPQFYGLIRDPDIIKRTAVFKNVPKYGFCQPIILTLMKFATLKYVIKIASLHTSKKFA